MDNAYVLVVVTPKNGEGTYTNSVQFQTFRTHAAAEKAANFLIEIATDCAVTIIQDYFS